jgi:hypothetical protein
MITLLAVYLGTNLFYYTFGWGEMSHSYLFFVISVFAYFTIKWFDTKKYKYLFTFSFLAGFATLIRPTDCLILLFPLLIGVRNTGHLKERIVEFAKQKSKLVLAALAFVFPFFIQMLYWKSYAGTWFFFPYGKQEGFFWADPQIINFLFSFRKGWFVYTPMMFLAVIGIFFLRKFAMELFSFMVVFFLMNIYVLSSWWDWGFGGSFGCRALIQHYVFFAFGFAALTAGIFRIAETNRALNYMIRAFMFLLVIAIIKLNYDQSWKYKYGLIHYSGMTREAYFYTLGKSEFTPDELKEFNSLVKEPVAEEMLSGKRD